ncbi:deoxyribose-phosphate aldolase [Neodiprion pinetum]|uniref:deoxyribose-phosphate aldolase n=1 Tax=Neodiprion pinetum TaxID=441929 RepID=UPI001EE0C764|nr:deoxyribose-phosphate aldolase [Neodiprion pinetum]
MPLCCTPCTLRLPKLQRYQHGYAAFYGKKIGVDRSARICVEDSGSSSLILIRQFSKFFTKHCYSSILKLLNSIKMVEKNLGRPFDASLIKRINLNVPAINTRVRYIIEKANSITECNRVAWLIKAVTCIDLTTLGGDDTFASVERLTKKAVKPIVLPFEWEGSLSTAAVCVYPARVADVVQTLKNLNATGKVNVASVATGFPSGQYPLQTRMDEISLAVSNGATEIDIVINRTLALTHQWEKLYNEIKLMKQACGKAKMKTILATGELFDLKDVYRASIIAAMAGSDFIKTSTGKETVNATLPVGIVMCRAIRDYHNLTGYKVGFKPAGGIKTWGEALQWLVLIKEELSDVWLHNSLFRIGASSVLGDITSEINRSLDEVKEAKVPTLYEHENFDDSDK